MAAGDDTRAVGGADGAGDGQCGALGTGARGTAMAGGAAAPDAAAAAVECADGYGGRRRVFERSRGRFEQVFGVKGVAEVEVFLTTEEQVRDAYW